MSTRARLGVSACALVFLAAGTQAERGYKVIAHPSVPIKSLTRAEVSQLFLKRSTRWPDGAGVVPVDLSVSSETREAFSRDVHGRGTAAVDAYWQKQIFSGRDLPPVTKSSEAEVVAYVRATPGTIGYVSPGADAGGVKLIEVQ